MKSTVLNVWHFLTVETQERHGYKERMWDERVGFRRRLLQPWFCCLTCHIFQSLLPAAQTPPKTNYISSEGGAQAARVLKAPQVIITGAWGETPCSSPDRIPKSPSGSMSHTLHGQSQTKDFFFFKLRVKVTITIHFHVYTLVLFIFTMLCNQHLSPGPKHFHHPEGGILPSSSHSPSPFPSPWQPPICFQSVWICLFQAFCINGIM